MSIMSDDDFVRLFQRTFGLKEDGWAGRDTEAKLHKLAVLAGVVVPVAPISAIPADYWPCCPRSRAATSFSSKRQHRPPPAFISSFRSTWLGEGGAWGMNAAGKYLDRPAFGGLKPSAEEQLERATTFTARNAAYLKSQGIPVNKASLYAAHFFGAGMASKVIGADVSARADLIAGPAATEANKSILKNRTVGQFLTWLHSKTGEWAR